jgi:tetratricopeptide (TPR) repeat protein
MRRSWATALAAVLVVMFSGVWAVAAPQKPRQPLGNNPHPVTWTSTKRPAAPPRVTTPAAPSHSVPARHDHGHDHWYPRDRYVFVPYYYGYGDNFGYRYGYDDDSYYYTYPQFWYSTAPGYGPQGMHQFMGWNNGAQFAQNDDGVPPPARQANLADEPQTKRGADRATNAHSNEIARKFIAYGDALFAQQKYTEANDRYRKAARSAPQLADAWFRQGFALAAVGRCDLASAAVKRGLKLDPSWPKSKFDIAVLFGNNEPVKNASLDALADAVMAKPADADRLFVLGVMLHFNGQADRAAAFFDRAEQVVKYNVGHIEAFLDRDQKSEKN